MCYLSHNKNAAMYYKYISLSTQNEELVHFYCKSFIKEMDVTENS